MAEIVNLNRARKAKAKATTAVEANANRARFGRTKAEKNTTSREADRRDTLLDGAKLED